jgi:hypothetical protein
MYKVLVSGAVRRTDMALCENKLRTSVDRIIQQEAQNAVCQLLFWRVRKISKRFFTSVRPHGETRLPLDGFT